MGSAVGASVVALSFLICSPADTTTGIVGINHSLIPVMTAVGSDHTENLKAFETHTSINCTIERSVAERVNSLREQFSLSAEQLSRLFGVSRRTVNNWIAGRVISESNLRRLLRVENALAQINGTPEDRRIALFSRPFVSDKSLYETLRAEVEPEVLQGVGLRAVDQVSAPER